MRKIIVFLLLTLLCFPIIAETIDEKEENKTGFRIDGGAGVIGSLYSAYVTVNPELLYDFDFFALGGGVNTMFGTSFGDIYIVPYLEAELVWFYLAGGAAFQVKEPNPASSEAPDGYVDPFSDNNVLPYIMAGADVPLIPVGPGSIGLDLYLGVMPTASPVEVVDNQDNALGNIIGTIITTLFTAVFNFVKIGGSIYYTVTF